VLAVTVVLVYPVQLQAQQLFMLVAAVDQVIAVAVVQAVLVVAVQVVPVITMLVLQEL
jgi:hypothetical protein